MVWIGVYPNTFLKPMEPSVKKFITHVEAKRATVMNIEQAKKQSQLQMTDATLTSLPLSAPSKP